MANYYQLALLLLLCLPISSKAQEVNTYEIAGITVVGCNQTDTNAIKQMSGLNIGDKIQLPGPNIQNAMRRLLELHLFEDVQIEKVRMQADLVWFEINITEAPKVKGLTVTGLKKTQLRQWKEWLKVSCPQGTAWLPAQNSQLRAALANKLIEEGYEPEAAVLHIHNLPNKEQVNLSLQFSKLKKQRLAKIYWQGVAQFSTKKLERLLGKKFLSKPIFNENWQKESLDILLAHYHDNGYLDATINAESEKINADWHWFLAINEGLPYTFGNISWQGAEHFDPQFLQEILGIKKGDPYRPDYLQRRLNFDPEQGDISGLYMNRGHLFFKAEVIPTSLNDHEFDIIIRITEGPVATVRDVKITGNDRTNDHVIRRELITKPGRVFSREEIIRSQRALINLGYFNPETLGIETEIDPKTGEVDLVYNVEEKRNDKFEVSAGFNPGGNDQKAALIGTLGFTFNNFSLRELLKGNWRDAHGDGQQLSIRAQSSGASFQAYNLNFQEPWFRGQPQSMGFSIFHQRFASQDSLGWNNTLAVSGATMNWGRRLPWGNGGWALSSELGYQFINLHNYLDITLDDGRELSTGRFNNVYGKLQLAYQDVDDLFFPHKGSRIQISGQWTPPWASTFNNEGLETFERLSYHKYRLSAEQFLPIGKKLVFRLSAKTGALLSYRSDQNTAPFERFELGGNGMTGSQQASFVGNDVLSLRGYDPSDIIGSSDGGGAAFAKLTAELRYPLFNTASARGYILGFAEAGNAWKDVRSLNPFDLKRSAGLGIRLQIPMLGMIGFDYGIGFDKLNYDAKNWQNSGNFNLIFGYEPE